VTTSLESINNSDGNGQTSNRRDRESERIVNSRGDTITDIESQTIVLSNVPQIGNIAEKFWS